ncbi:diadenylate cyclase CdaA [Haliscomenobacter sp.]|uniref:diadenylate cyclase CdaA n=1 Tax=Haliscomenobacter sp. TaxID=2717303 RepID=UPI003364E7F4
MLLLFKIGFLPIRIWDLLDILIVGYLIYLIYRLLRGNIAFNIFIGVLTLYVVYWLVRQLEMQLLSAVLDKFVSVGVIVIVIIFQQEVRNFLLLLGKSALQQRSNVLVQFLIGRNTPAAQADMGKEIVALKNALMHLSETQTGALIVLAKGANLEALAYAGVEINASISEQLLESIFNKTSPLHDGAVILRKGKIMSAGAVLPVSETADLPPKAGLRHRAAIGVTEQLRVAALIVSEETGHISWAYEGQLTQDVQMEDLDAFLQEHL